MVIAYSTMLSLWPTAYNLTSFLHLTLFICHVCSRFHYAVSCLAQKLHHLQGHLSDVVTSLIVTLLHVSPQIRGISK